MIYVQVSVENGVVGAVITANDIARHGDVPGTVGRNVDGPIRIDRRIVHRLNAAGDEITSAQDQDCRQYKFQSPHKTTLS